MDLGERLIKRIEEDLAECGVVDQQAKKEGRQMVMMLSPKKKQ
jgi:translation initiation factor IF-3